jgi:hypothetical protein
MSEAVPLVWTNGDSLSSESVGGHGSLVSEPPGLSHRSGAADAGSSSVKRTLPSMK